MTTIVDPNGSPAIVYNLSGTVIVPITANDDVQGNATQIPNISGWQIILGAVPSIGNNALKLHPDADVGTIVEVYAQSGNPESLQVFPASSQTINNSTDPLTASLGAGLYLRKISATDWRHVQ
jgi:hypothetical protein